MPGTSRPGITKSAAIGKLVGDIVECRYHGLPSIGWTTPPWGFGGNYLHVEANYLLLVENLLDGQDRAWLAMRQIVQRLVSEEQQGARAVA